MLVLIKYDPVLKRTPWACLISGCMMLFSLPFLGALVGVGSGASLKESAAGTSLAFPLLLATAHVVFLRSLGERVTDWDRSLPVTMWSAFQSKMLGSFLAFSIPMLTAALVLCGPLALVGGFLNLLLGVCSALLAIAAGVTTLNAWKPHSENLGYFEAALSLLATLVVVFGPIAGTPVVAIAIHLVITVAGLAWISSQLPSGMPAAGVTEGGRVVPLDNPLMLKHITPRLPGAGTAVSSSTAKIAKETDEPFLARIMSPVNWFLLRGVTVGPPSFFAPFSGPLGLYLLGVFFLTNMVREEAFLDIWLPILALHGVRTGLGLLHGLGSLPISRTRILPFVVMPPLIVIMAISALRGAASPEYQSFGRLSEGVRLGIGSPRTMTKDPDYSIHVRVPPELWQWSHSEDAPTTKAPWGESSTPLLHPLFPGSALGVFNPFDVQGANTIRFASWQFSRALSKVYGLDVSPREVRKKWFSAHDPYMRIREIGRWDTRDYVWTDKSPIRPRNLPLSAAFVGILVWFLSACYAMRSNVPPLTAAGWKRRKLWNTAIPFAVFGFFGLRAWLNSLDHALEPIVLARFHAAMDSMLGSSAMAWSGLIIVTFTLCYAILRRRIQRLEVPTSPKNG